ncbi:MAG TPA: FAD-linked oxidase C-terminal domain-containing protein [Burkholderiales bacterium]|nr:FAD-linked oxidase C-terminal domain-containing protein [Burkholderiales bacterium]
MPELPPRFTDALQTLLGNENVYTDPADRWPYGQDNSRRHAQPDAVALPATHEHVVEIVRLCNEFSVPVVGRGRGTGTAGSAVPTHGGLIVSFERMDRILETAPADRLIRVQAGVTNQAVQDAAAAHGFFWPPDPTSAAYSTVAGNIALNAGGPRSVKYGATRDNVLALTAVSGAGETLRTGSATTKNSTGYDLTRLLIGSEGTLALIAEATLKLLPLPESRRTCRAVYRDIRAATQAVVSLMSQPVIPCALEFMDRASIEMIRTYSTTPLPHEAGALLIIDVDGPEAAMPAAVAGLEKAARNEGMSEFIVAATSTETEALWAARKALSPALRTVAPNKLNEDVVVPVSRIPELIEGLDTLSRQYRIPIVNFGHAGNGNIHVNMLYDTQNPEQEKAALPCLTRVFELVLSLGGTLSGEHGIGLAKREFIDRAIDAPTLALMRSIKRQFDPKGILNPGKIFPD